MKKYFLLAVTISLFSLNHAYATTVTVNDQSGLGGSVFVHDLTELQNLTPLSSKHNLRAGSYRLLYKDKNNSIQCYRLSQSFNDSKNYTINILGGKIGRPCSITVSQTQK